MDTMTITPQIEQTALTLTAQAQALAVTDQVTLEQAAGLRARLKTTLKAAAEFFDPIGRKMDAAKAEFLAGRRRIETPLTEAVTVLNGQITAYLDAERIAREQEEVRLTAQAQAQAETAQIEQAAALEQIGQPEAAAEVLAHPMTPAPITLPPPTAPGLATRTDWKFMVEDAALVPHEYMMVDTIKVGGVVRALKGMTRIPGIRVFSQIVPLTRRR